MNKKLTFNDLNEANHRELKKVYKLNDRELEKQVRSHLNGASSQEKQKIYEKIWDNKIK